MIDFSIPILYNMLNCKLARFYINGRSPNDDKIKILEYSPDTSKEYKMIWLKIFDFHHYCAMLLISSLIYYSSKITFDPNFVKLNRDLTYPTIKNPKTKELQKTKGRIIKPDFTIIKSIDDDLYLILIKFANNFKTSYEFQLFFY
jgi:hypothetical protein